MRTFTRLSFSLLAAIILPLALWANVIVKGTVKFANGQPVAGYIVYIESDTIPGTPLPVCPQKRYTHTGQNGFYMDSLICNAAITRVTVYLYNCDGSIIRQSLPVTASGVVECNFTICARPCAVSFRSDKVDSIPFAMQFTMLQAFTGYDPMVKFKWSFGDGSLDTVHYDPLHIYAQRGIFNACLTIRTASGCTSDFCKLINSDSLAECRPEFNFSPVQNAINKIKFNSAGSFAGTADSVISRKWNFGDSDSIPGNVVAPEHQYAQPGVYNVCLTIKTRTGCEKKLCRTVVVVNNECRPEFTHEAIAGTINLIKFNSAASTTSPADSIISRKWTFGDSTSLAGNVVAPQHQYPGQGVYIVCLTIKTKLGCEKTVCKTIVIGQANCHADFTHQVLAPTSATGRVVKFNSIISTTGPQDSIISRTWKFGDGTGLQGNQPEPVHTYLQPGTYTVCLVIKTARGCSDSICKPVVVPPPATVCRAEWAYEVLPPNSATGAKTIRFNSQQSNTGSGDSIISRKWTFGDGTSLTGNIINPLHTYAQTGSYIVCLYITSARGCKDSACKTVIVPPAVTHCKPKFGHIATALSVVFNSTLSQVAPGDSIINRFWTFGDGTSGGNQAIITHQYPRAGIYEVCLRIQTRNGCMETWCKKLAVVTVAGNCVPFFTAEQISGTLRTMRFNSEAAYSQLAGDSIIERNWTFGDGASLGGNVVNPLHQYGVRGSYTVCLKLKTRLGCDTRWCREIMVQGSDTANNSAAVTIVNLYPVPVRTILNATIWSRYNNVNSTLGIYDVYGVLKWSQNKLLIMGNSSHQIQVSQLANGPYIFKVTTIYGVQSRNFFKVQ